MNFCLPADFKESTLDIIKSLKIEYPNHNIEELYGNISPTPILGSGRGWNIKDVKVDNFKKLDKYIQLLNKQNIFFNYTLNTSCTENLEFEENGKKEIKIFINELINIGVKRITLAVPSLIDFIHNSFPSLEITASVITGVNSVYRANQIKNLGAKTIALHEDETRNFTLISSIKDNVDVKIEIILNSMCNYNCLFRQNHYNALAHYKENLDYNKLIYFPINCYKLRIEDNSELIKSPWIRPEDLYVYDNAGISLFKFIGRENITNFNIEKLLRSYFEMSFDGNLLDLIHGFSVTNSKYIDNKSLDGFIKYFFKKNNCLSECGTINCTYCSDYAKNIIK